MLLAGVEYVLVLIYKCRASPDRALLMNCCVATDKHITVTSLSPPLESKGGLTLDLFCLQS